MSARVNTRSLRLGGNPRVQLLPPIVRQRELARRTRRLAVFAVVAAVAIASGGTAYTFLRAVQAQVALDAAHAQTLTIQQEQAKYVEASQIATLIANTESAQKEVTANEVDWLGLANALAGYLPAGTTLTLGMQAPAPWEPELVPEGELRAARVALVEVTILAPDYQTAANFVTAVYAIEGVADAYITGTKAEEGGYRTTISVAFDADILTLRFADSEPEQDAEGAEADATTQDAAGEPAVDASAEGEG